jgi:hypothetical protein
MPILIIKGHLSNNGQDIHQADENDKNPAEFIFCGEHRSGCVLVEILQF